ADVRTSGLVRTRRMAIFEMTAIQGRARLRCLWFHGTYLKDKFKPGQMVALYGKVEVDERRGDFQIIQPQFEILGDPSDERAAESAGEQFEASLAVGRIVPIYEPAVHRRLTSRRSRRI